MALPLLGVGIGTILRYLGAVGIGMMIDDIEGLRNIAGKTMKFAGEVLEIPGEILKWAGQKLSPEDKVTQAAVGDILVKTYEAKEKGLISPEREKQIMAGLAKYLTEMGIPPNEVHNYMLEGAQMHMQGDFDPHLKDEIDKTFYGLLYHIEGQHEHRRGLGLSPNL